MNYISVVIPAKNEEKTIGRVISAVRNKADEIIVVDGYSKDKTVKIAKKFHCKVYYDSIGKGSALIKGGKRSTGGIGE